MFLNHKKDKSRKMGMFKKYAHLWAVLLFCLFLIAIFFKIATELGQKHLELFDQAIINAVDALRNPWLTEFMKTLTTLGSAKAMITIVLFFWLLYLIYKKYFKDTALISIMLTVTWLMNDVLKWLYHRSRPITSRLVNASGYSFPSGHAMISLVFYGMVAYFLWVNLKTLWAKYLSASFFALLVFCIGISRVYLGVHYPSDVIAGFAAGGVMLTGAIIGLQMSGDKD